MVAEALTLRRRLVMEAMQDLDKGAGQRACIHWIKLPTSAVLYGAFLLESKFVDEALPVLADGIQASLVRCRF